MIDGCISGWKPAQDVDHPIRLVSGVWPTELNEKANDTAGAQWGGLGQSGGAAVSRNRALQEQRRLKRCAVAAEAADDLDAER
jgi:hypothetical protein